MTPGAATTTTPTALPFRLSQLARSGGLHLYIAPDLRSYRQLAEELAWYLQDAPHLLLRFPAWETLPYDRTNPHHAIVGERLATLAALLNDPSRHGLLLTALPAFLQRLMPPEVVTAHVWRIHKGDRLDITTLRERLSRSGMLHVERVQGIGEFAARGGLLDLWPATLDRPLRLDMFGDEIDAIRYFDPESQRSAEMLDQFISTPVREIILDSAAQERFVAAFTARFPHLRSHPMLATVRAGRPHPGIESLLPLVYGQTSRLSNYLPKSATLWASDGIEQERSRFGQQVRAQFDLMKLSQEPLLSPQEIYAIETPIKASQLADNQALLPAPTVDDFADKPAAKPRPLHHLLEAIARYQQQGFNVLLVGHGVGQLERMIELFVGQPVVRCHGLSDLTAPLAAAIGFLDAGFLNNHNKTLLLTGRELLGQRLPRKRSGSSVSLRADLFSSLRELRENDFVVHEEHGIGRYQGLVSIVAGGVTSDYLHIGYAGEASIYLPVEELGRLHRYSGAEAVPVLDKPGATRWKKVSEKTRRDVLVMAHEVIESDRKRKLCHRPPIRLVGESLADYEEFAARFPFEETDDQAAAIEATLGDLCKQELMDRVICGDVGFGKTEVAMRAAFVVANSGRQVGLLAPTTVLANQHFSSFSERFAGTGIKVGVISRLQTASEVARTLNLLAEGEILLIIGTHRLLSEDVSFLDLGLVIVDEEQRFGVKHKEKLKTLHSGADLLTMSATPIPRTLHQTLSGLRGVSIISTPPAEREAIRTIVSRYDEGLMREAVRRELFRGGQIYYLHNHVQSIERIVRRLAELVPEAVVGMAHGQMGAAELDRQMVAFYEGRLHILVCTTIIESGLDVPNANTLIVERADLLGLGQLHQIRGRVGRSRHQAYAYFFTPDPKQMTAEANERLQAIVQHSELGAGFFLARQDMEIRGAGNLLGAEQSGHIDEVGLDLYMEMLADAVAEARGQKPEEEPAVDLHTNLPLILPANYIPQTGERLQLYRRLARAADDNEINMLHDEMSDRFGKLPAEAGYALDAARLRWRARKLRIPKLDLGDKALRLTFTAASPINMTHLLLAVQREPKKFQLRPDGSLSLLGDFSDPKLRLRTLIHFLDERLNDNTPNQTGPTGPTTPTRKPR